MTTRFKNAIDALVHAYFNDTLAKGNCHSCAIGSIVANSWGFKPKSLGEKIVKDGISNARWSDAFYTSNIGIQSCNENYFTSREVLACVRPTGYSIEELMNIEHAFEKNAKIHHSNYCDFTKKEVEEDQYNGLMAVLDVLCDIEGVADVSEYKELFSMSV